VADKHAPPERLAAAGFAPRRGLRARRRDPRGGNVDALALGDSNGDAARFVRAEKRRVELRVGLERFPGVHVIASRRHSEQSKAAIVGGLGDAVEPRKFGLWRIDTAAR